MNVATFLLLCCPRLCAAQISLVAQDNQKLRLFAIGSVLEYPWGDLAQRSALTLRVRLA